MTSASCLAGTGLTPDQLADPAREIEGRQELAVLRNILRTLDPALPFAIMAGLRYHATTQGMWGFAIMSSPDARSAVEIGFRYFDLSFSFNRPRVEVTGEDGRFYYDDSDNPDDLRAALVERDLAALVTIERDLYGRSLPARSLQLRASRPPYVPTIASLFDVEPQFGADVNCLTFDAKLLCLPQPLADDFGLRVSEEQCRILLQRRGARSGVAGRVRAEILRKPGEFPSMNSVAEQLGMTTRTLHNQLAREGTSYRELLEEIRETLAEELLAISCLTVDEIAHRLGYAETSSFVAAFKRWKGVPPKSYKRTKVEK
ncbi:MAG TPA: AraC family transcriptional regulator [Polyangiaceae bacterium]|nr:AraC family transcriptional regulator [Polyangiaceae bacterium]